MPKEIRISGATHKEASPYQRIRSEQKPESDPEQLSPCLAPPEWCLSNNHHAGESDSTQIYWGKTMIAADCSQDDACYYEMVRSHLE